MTIIETNDAVLWIRLSTCIFSNLMHGSEMRNGKLLKHSSKRYSERAFVNATDEWNPINFCSYVIRTYQIISPNAEKPPTRNYMCGLTQRDIRQLNCRSYVDSKFNLNIRDEEFGRKLSWFFFLKVQDESEVPVHKWPLQYIRAGHFDHLMYYDFDCNIHHNSDKYKELWPHPVLFQKWPGKALPFFLI